MLDITEIRNITDKAREGDEIEKRRVKKIKVEKNKKKVLLAKAKEEAKKRSCKILKSLEKKIMLAAEEGLCKIKFYIRNIAKDDGYTGSCKDYRDAFIISYLVERMSSNFKIIEKNRSYPNIYFGHGTERYLIIKW